MTHSLVIGSGPAAAGAVLALAEDPTQRITILDIGHELERPNREALSRLAKGTPLTWETLDLDLITQRPVESFSRALPQKRAYGSDFPFRNVGQLNGLRPVGRANQFVVSGAYGGFSNVWGSQVMVFSRATFRDWPISLDEMVPHYRAILQEIPYAAEEDALDRYFPLVTTGKPLPLLAPRTQAVIRAAERQHHHLDRLGVTVGRARLAFEAMACVRCGLCMTGCPYSLIYSSAHTFNRLRQSRRIDYHGNLLAIGVGQDAKVPYVITQDLNSRAVHRFEADRLYVAAGALGTTRLVLGSLGIFDEDIELAESVQFVLPMISTHATDDPRLSSEFTLNQFNMVVSVDHQRHDVSQIHFYPYNDAILEALPHFLATRQMAPLTAQLLRRLTIGLGYLPSWVAPRLHVRARRPDFSHALPGIRLSGEPASGRKIPMFRKVVSKVLQVAPRIDLWPVLPMAFFAEPGKSYHFGGSFPHSDAPADGQLTTDRWGRLREWSRVHLVDASVFPTVPATTFTLTIMANAHRIATETRRVPE